MIQSRDGAGMGGAQKSAQVGVHDDACECIMCCRADQPEDSDCKYWDDDGCYCVCGSACACVPFHPDKPREPTR
jgi:hypothetical protein